MLPNEFRREIHGSFHVNSGEIVTVPEDTLSMREIYNRFRNGEPIDVNHYDPTYGVDEYQDIDVSVLDPIEVMELQQKYTELRNKHLAELQEKQEVNNDSLE